MADSDFNTTNLAAFVKTTYDLASRFGLRPELYFDAVATEQPTMLAMRGNVVTFTFYPDMAAATTELDEFTDPDTVSVTPSTVTGTLAEYGNVARSTAKYRGLSFEEMPGPDPAIGNLIGWNAGLSQDTLARNALVAGTNVVYPGSKTTRNNVAATDVATLAKLRYVVAKLRGNSARGWNGASYVTFMHPDVAYDVMSETGDAGWLVPANYSAADRRWNGTIGRIAGTDVIETPRAPIFANASNGAGGAGNVDVYASLTVAQEALAVAWSKPVAGRTAKMVLGPIVDKLKRHHTFGWYWLGVYKILRQECVYRFEAASSIGNNAA